VRAGAACVLGGSSGGLFPTARRPAPRLNSAPHARPAPTVCQVAGTSLHDPAPWANGQSFGAVLLEPTIIYVKRVLALHEKVGEGASIRGRGLGKGVCGSPRPGAPALLAVRPRPPPRTSSQSPRPHSRTPPSPLTNPPSTPPPHPSPQVGLKGVVHITGGGMTENIPRVIPKGLGVNVKIGSWEVRRALAQPARPRLPSTLFPSPGEPPIVPGRCARRP
jgi:hypothetical protein